MALPWEQLIVQAPRFQQWLSGTNEVTGTQWVEESVRAGQAQFRLSDRALAQLWWYSFGNSVIAPAVHLMVGFGSVPSMDFSRGLTQDGFWCGYRPESPATSVTEAGEQVAAAAAPLIDALHREFDVRPAPLWALTADALRQSALEAGNEHFEPIRGVQVAEQLCAGLGAGAGAEIRGILDGEVSEKITDDSYVFAPRTSCCMVFRSPGSGLCTSCPRRSQADRLASQVARSLY